MRFHRANNVAPTSKLRDVKRVAYIAETLEAIIAGPPQSKIAELMLRRPRKTSSRHQLGDGKVPKSLYQ